MYIVRIVAMLAPWAFSGLAIAGTPNAVPEPETLALLALGVAAVAVTRWRKKK